jgi:hypothetical protein
MSVASSDALARTVAVHFMLDADPSPGLLPRLLQPFAKRDLIPDCIRAHRSAADLHVEIVMEAMPVHMVHLVEGNLRQVVGVRQLTQAQAVALREAA